MTDGGLVRSDRWALKTVLSTYHSEFSRQVFNQPRLLVILYLTSFIQRFAIIVTHLDPRHMVLLV